MQDPRIDVLGRREILRIAPNIARVRRLVHSYIVDSQMSWEREVVEVYNPEVGRHPQVNDDVLVQ
jgi:hypothetical protein